MSDTINKQIEVLKAQWASWAEKRCSGIKQKDLVDEYRSFAATMCAIDIRELLKETKNK